MISREEVEKIAKLARLNLDRKEIEGFQKDLSSILDHFNSLKEVEADAVLPTFHPTEGFLERNSKSAREDRVCSLSLEKTKDLIDSAPEKKERYVKVKAVF